MRRRWTRTAACIALLLLVVVLASLVPFLLPAGASAERGRHAMRQLRRGSAPHASASPNFGIPVSPDEVQAHQYVCARAGARGSLWRLGVVLPVTSSSLDEAATRESQRALNERRPADVLVLQAILRTLVATSLQAPLGCVRTHVFMGVASGDDALVGAAPWLFDQAQAFAKNASASLVDFELVLYPGGSGGQTLAEMYNELARRAYAAGCEFFIPLNDDMIVLGLWREVLLHALLVTPAARGLPHTFGAAFVLELDQSRVRLTKHCPPYPLVSRLHLALMGGRLFDDMFASYGIDLELCALYDMLNASVVVPRVMQQNHLHLVGGVLRADRLKRIRYTVDDEAIFMRFAERARLFADVARWLLGAHAARGAIDEFWCDELRPAGETAAQYFALPAHQRTAQARIACTGASAALQNPRRM